MLLFTGEFINMEHTVCLTGERHRIAMGCIGNNTGSYYGIYNSTGCGKQHGGRGVFARPRVVCARIPMMATEWSGV